jgi:hypothetical protein
MKEDEDDIELEVLLFLNDEDAVKAKEKVFN